MTRIVVEIDRQQDLDLLLAFLRRLNLRVVEPQADQEQPGPGGEALREFILRGLPGKDNVEEYIRDFEGSGEGSVLPGRDESC